MITLLDHVENLSKYTTDKPEIILQSIIQNPLIMDDESLLSYFIECNSWGNDMMILQADGNGNSIWEWVKKISKQYRCNKIYFISQRWKPLCRKYKFSPVGVLCEREGFT